MKEQLIIVSIIVAAILLSMIIFLLIKRRRLRPLPMDEMEGHDFEYYCADLLKDNGFLEVEVTKGSGDFGADILAEKDGITYAFQCKCYDKPIGVKAVQEIYAGRDYYGRMVGVVMTNQYFTQPAVELAQKLNIMLWDRGYVDGMDIQKGRTK
ncbi:restriction endonuclease [Butyrivibrio hungatei]|uniref:Restriction endonuclease family protein n=1 Tax=Butyrivibrio hungatei TaxID=185008 RepID=A0A1D9P5A9_9FIRM|nr:restriction endonuclease [Butyrivibrio hungatei]AOZ97673.1 restriction endonuclease family protein [Butyrivibrio hungatei]